MRRLRVIPIALFFFAVLLAVPLESTVAAAELKPLIYDEAGLLNQEEYDELNVMANEYGAERETDIMIVTINSPEAYDVMAMTQDFYDYNGPGYDKTHGNTVILMMDMTHKEFYLAGFYKAEEYLDDERLDKIRNKITPDLKNGDYKLAFQKYIETAHRYMGFDPEVNPDNILLNIWVQLGISVVIGGIIVTLMVRRSGGRITVNSRTYEDSSSSGLMDYEDSYLHTSTTRRKIEKSDSSSGGGGGTTSGGHSHSGSRGSF
ncbi:TPM domain-containing protein [Paenibacillus sp. N3/727]|uniref:TPM domain-containing protein n=1 Tax=Paenibacillus sp. N3/727 TaxID=2925845 RepID=UPI001F53A229|nr:TPM domain-containing protein [Paenibacillus sp. N3/727]UNK18783.1 TPM domain-containing protein [Paenibacillus sp. N3/727]